MEKKLEIPVRQTQKDHQEGRESSSSSSMEKGKLSTEVVQPAVDQPDDQEDHGVGDQSSSTLMEIKKLNVDQPQESSSMGNEKLEVDHQPHEYPKGFRFLPTELELVRDYLKKKVNKEDVPVPINEIQEVEVYGSNPAELAESYKIPNQKGIYLFTDYEHKYGKLAERPSGVPGKYWTSTGIGKYIKEGDKTLGIKTSFKFVSDVKEDKASNPEWLMKEYAVTDPDKAEAKMLDGFVLCHIYEDEEKAVEEVEDIIVNKEELEAPSEPTMIRTSTEEYFKSFPSGVLFSPTDKELVVYYLLVKNSLNGNHLPINRIHEVDLYNYHPQHLTEMHELCREDGWYFFVRKNKEKNYWPNRKAASGYWKVELEGHEPLHQRNIDSTSTVKCHKSFLRYYEDKKLKQPAGVRKIWEMHEYSIRTIPDADVPAGTGKPVSYVEKHRLCREDGWYFFVRKNEKKIGSQRATAVGYWKLEQEGVEPPLQRNIDSSSTVKCQKSFFKYYEDQKQKQPDEDRRLWKMYEYSINNIPDAEDDDDDLAGTGKQKLKQYWDLCKIWRSTGMNEDALEDSDEDA